MVHKVYKFDTDCFIYGVGIDPVHAHGSGEIEIKSYVGNEEHSLVLKNVWYAPTISKNLFLVLSAHNQNAESQFVSNATT